MTDQTRKGVADDLADTMATYTSIQGVIAELVVVINAYEQALTAHGLGHLVDEIRKPTPDALMDETEQWAEAFTAAGRTIAAVLTDDEKVKNAHALLLGHTEYAKEKGAQAS